MLYQLSYTPTPSREVASVSSGRKAQWMTGNPSQLPLGPVNTFCVAAR